MTDEEKLKEILDIITVDIPNGYDTFCALQKIKDIINEED